MGSLRNLHANHATTLEKLDFEIQRDLAYLKTTIHSLLAAFNEAGYEDDGTLGYYDLLFHELETLYREPYRPGLPKKLHEYLFSTLYNLVDYFLELEHFEGRQIEHPGDHYVFSDLVYKTCVPILKQKILTWDQDDVRNLRNMREDLDFCLRNSVFLDRRHVDSEVPAHTIPSESYSEVWENEIVAVDKKGRTLKRIVKEIIV